MSERQDAITTEQARHAMSSAFCLAADMAELAANTVTGMTAEEALRAFAETLRETDKAATQRGTA